MPVIVLINLCLVGSLVALSSQQFLPNESFPQTSHEGSCLPGLFYNGTQCRCGRSYPDIIQCNGTAIFLQMGYCVTLDARDDTIVAGYCILTAKSSMITSPAVLNAVYKPVSVNISILNQSLCHVHGRTGDLCGRCAAGHYPLAYSYSLTCIPCPNAKLNWLKYIMAAYLPLTAFCVIILFFKVHITSSHLFAVIYYCQVLSTPCLLQLILTTFPWHFNYKLVRLLKLLASFYGIWNLDFFRPFYSDLCLGIGVLPTLILDYAIAFYPLLLMVITYLLIHLYDRNFKLLVAMWRPFHLLFSLFSKNWDIKTST